METKNTLEVANTIKNQIGGKALFMIGAKNLAGDEKSLTFRIMRNTKQISFVRVTLEWSDTYKMEFLKVRKHTLTTIAEHTGIYSDQLNTIIEKETGLYTSL